MQIELFEHQKYPWLVHDLLQDFEVEDVWQFPVQLTESETIPYFQTQLMGAMEKLSNNGLTGLLFKFRFFLGRIFGWDESTETLKINQIKKGSLRERFAEKYQFRLGQMPKADGNAEFVPVYSMEKEALAEIENGTVHAGMHLGKVPNAEGYTVQMTVYVKPKGRLGRFYMALIKPFRLTIVYPAMMRMVGQYWEENR